MARPPVTPEPLALWGGQTAQVDRFALNPGLAYLTATRRRPSLSGDPSPSFFHSGDLPPFTASGLDPSTLRWVGWLVRHTAAMTTDASLVLTLVEASADPAADLVALNTDEGTGSLNAYLTRMLDWAKKPAPGPAVEMITGEEYDQFWGAR